MKAKTIQIPQKLQHFLSFFLEQIRYLARKISHMEKYEKIVVIGVGLLFVLVLFSPLMLISPNTSTIAPSYGFLLSISFLKSFVLIVGSFVVILLRSLHKKTKIFIIEKLGFQGNKYLITVILLAISLGSFITLGETIGLLGDYTTVVKLTIMYYIIQIVLIVLFAFCLFIIFSSQHYKFKGHVVGYHGKKSSDSQSSEGGLFDNVYHDEDK